MNIRIRQGLIFALVFLPFIIAIVGQPNRTEAANSSPNLGIKALSAILIDADTGKILFEKDADAKRSPASMTKMMSEYLILDAIKGGRISWNSPVKINDYMYKLSQNDSLSGIPLREDITYTVEELYTAMAVESANAATVALAHKVAGSEKKFVEMMNDKARSLGLKNAKFVNSTGLNNRDLFGYASAGGPHEENMMSARATAKLAYHLLKDHPEVLKYTSIEKQKFTKGMSEPFQMKNWNYMLPGLIYGKKGNGVDGLKTGHTQKAGYCFTGTAKQHGMRLISVVMKTDSLKARFDQTKKLFNYGFGHFKKVTLLEKGYQPHKKRGLPVIKGKEDHVGLQTEHGISTMIKIGTKKKYKPVLSLDKSLLTKDGELTAPVKKGQKVGTIKLTYSGKDDPYGYLTKDGNQDLTSPVVTTKDVDKASWISLLFRAIGHFFSNIWLAITHFFSSIL